jgi:pullulanase
VKRKTQGFINGLWYDNNGSSAATLQQLLDTGDLVKLALAGTLRDYSLVDRNGNLVTGAQLNYGGQPAGYTLNPPDVINYISAHDNQTLFDNNQYKIPMATTMAGKWHLHHPAADNRRVFGMLGRRFDAERVQ